MIGGGMSHRGMFRRKVGGGGLPYTPPLDANNAAAAYSIRKLRTDYTGFCMRVQLGSSGTGDTLDVGFDVNGLVDTSAISAFGISNAQNVYVRNWYDQTGNALDLFGGGISPKIYDEGLDSFELLNGIVALNFDGTKGMSVVNSKGSFNFLHDGTKCSLFNVLQCGVVSNPNVLYYLLGNTASSAEIGYDLQFDDRSAASFSNSFNNIVSNGTNSSGRPVSVREQNAITPNQQVLLYSTVDAGNATAANRLYTEVNNDGEQQLNTQTGTPSGANATRDFFMGRYPGGNFFQLNGYYQECIIFDSDQSGNKSTLQTNIIDYFNIPI